VRKIRQVFFRDFLISLNNFPSNTGVLRRLLCTKTIFGRDSAPDPAGGAYDLTPDLLVGLGMARGTPLPNFPSTPSASRSGRLRFGAIAFYPSLLPNTNSWLQGYTPRTPVKKWLRHCIAAWPDYFCRSVRRWMSGIRPLAGVQWLSHNLSVSPATTVSISGDALFLWSSWAQLSKESYLPLLLAYKYT